MYILLEVCFYILSEVGSCVEIWRVIKGVRMLFYLSIIIFLARFAHQYYA